jgi:dynactin-5
MEVAKVDIGDRVTIKSGSSLVSCIVKDGVIIGNNSVICEGSVVGENSVITNNTVVPPNSLIPDNTVFGGNPARFIRDTLKEDILNM